MSYPAAYEEDRSRLFFEPDGSPEISLEAAIERWKITTAAPKIASRKPSLEQFDEICKQNKSRDKVSKFLRVYSSNRLYTDL